MIHVLIAEDAQLFRSGLAALLEDEPDIVVAETVDCGSKLVAAGGRVHPEVALIDIDLADMDGIAATRALRGVAPECAVIVMADRRRTGDLRRAVGADAAGYVLTDTSPSELTDAIRRVARGERVIDAELAFAEIGAARSPLTPRELDVLEAVADGATVPEIAEQLVLSTGTVRNYVARVLTKLHARTRVEAVTIATEHGWLRHSVDAVRRSRPLRR
ncbi:MULTISPECIES: response regulator transcription factor [Actinomadura]|uniref:Response regulator transcription factor n=1 Tax=Actinomadura yumaensis TaxID=111807 RepID=A0ABW2CLZ5_9ACTN|nr:response regulator transcription factor [Actinomadura sp. J1-007]MWK37835.1 response regulator [Actinomadura sp. J1-007]